jgi:sporulation protein YlmC with PRC-barrel domain
MDLGVEAVPHGELAIHRGANVEATDGKIGHVGEFVVEPDSGHITHVVLKKGHLWRKREIAVPVSHVQQVIGDVVYLDLDKDAVKALPEPSLVRQYKSD